MSVSPTSSNVFINYSSYFSQGGNKAFSAFQAAVANYGNGAFQVRRASASTLDILDISPEGLALTNTLQPPTPADTTENAEAVNDVTLETPKISEAERVEMIRVNKNAVLERVNELLAEKGIEVSADQSFELTTNFLDGTISIAGIEDTSLAAAINEALAGDEELIARMKKTREELGLAEPANTVSRNFTIGFESTTETPANTELEYKIDLFVNKPVPLLEGAPEAEMVENTVENTETTEEPAFYLSVLLSNKPKTEPIVNLITALQDNKISDNKTDKTDGEPENAQNTSTNKVNENTAQIKIPDFIPYEESPVEIAEPVSEIFPYSVFGSYFRADSVMDIGTEGVTLNWNLQFGNWDIAGNTTENFGISSETQQIFETLNIGGSTFYAVNPQEPQSLEDQAARLQSQFVNGFSQGLDSSWVENFITQNDLKQLGIFGYTS
ncbi:MAG: hypothetical protein LBU34_07330 [Planctomycetaceae bacterium]|jgi:hypothetical protein|nr:hypothetical protein [Planctomycetaceae bacterium]